MKLVANGTCVVRYGCLSCVRAGMDVYTDDFTADTPVGTVEYVNIICERPLDGDGSDAIVLAAHYDSKWMDTGDGLSSAFVGATDSAIPCALLLAFAAQLAREVCVCVRMLAYVVTSVLLSWLRCRA